MKSQEVGVAVKEHTHTRLFYYLIVLADANAKLKVHDT